MNNTYRRPRLSSLEAIEATPIVIFVEATPIVIFEATPIVIFEATPIVIFSCPAGFIPLESALMKAHGRGQARPQRSIRPPCAAMLSSDSSSEMGQSR
jgi:hypothetical protein